jgi:hypothetical protein
VPGPAPKPADQRARRNATIVMTRLPRSGRTGRPPTWPIGRDVVLVARHELAVARAYELRCDLEDAVAAGVATAAIRRQLAAAEEKAAVLTAQVTEQHRRETRVWRELWKTPQATAWETLGWTRDVASYVRHKVLGDLGDLESAKEARQWSDRLGLNPLALLRLRWEITDEDVPGAAAPPSVPRGPRGGTWGDLRVVAG